MRSHYRLWALPLVAFGTGQLAVVPSNAQDVEKSGLEEIVVRATRVEKPLDRVPASIGVVNQEDIQLGQQQLGLDESLVSIPGLFMQNRFNFAQDLRISIRGFGARANFGIRGIKIIVDGIPETLPDGQGQVDSIDLGSTQQVEVIRGPSSSLYGNASGGVINITSESGPAEPFIESRLSAGEFGYTKYQVKAGGRMDAFDYMVNASSLEMDGYRDQSRVENNQLNSKFRVRFDPSSELVAIFNTTDQPISDDPGGITREQAAENPRQARDLNVAFDAGEELDQQRLGLVYTKAFGENHEFSVNNYYVWRDFANKLPFTGGGAVELERFFVGGGANYTYTGTLAGRPNRVIVGADFDLQDDDRLRFDNNMGVIGSLTFDQNEEVTSTGVFVQNEFSIRDDLELTLGVRHDSVKFDVTDRFLADGDDSGSRTLDETSPMVGLLYSVSPAVNLFATVSTAFETPTTTEFANPSGGGGFNPTLDPQTATNYELGVKGTVGDRHWYEVAVFTIDVDDELIPFELASSPGRDFFENAGKSSREGIELAFTTQPLDGLTASLAYTYSDFEFDRFMDDNGNDFAGNKIPGTPENLLHGEIAYSHASGVYGIWDALFVDDFFVNNANTEMQDSYTVSNLRAGYRGRVGRWELSPFVGISNLFDEDYNANVRVNAFGGRFFEPGPDRNLYGGLTVRYDFGT